jgi:type III pantothenate kinase
VILTLDVGNSQIFGGVFQNRELVVRFRKPSRPPTSSDELGLFLRGVLRENGCDPSRDPPCLPFAGRKENWNLADE